MAGTLTSLVMGIIFGLIAGLITGCFYREKNKYFYLDTEYFDNAHFRELYKDDPGENLYLKQKEASRRMEGNDSKERLDESKGVELVLTLGTGIGSALFVDGRLVPNLELGHHPFQKGKTYEER